MASEVWTREQLMERGETVYANQCATCHQADGTGLPPAFPALADSELVSGPLDQNLALVVNGVEGTAMQGWGTLLSPADIASVLTFVRNSFGNSTGDMVQPEAVSAVTGEGS